MTIKYGSCHYSTLSAAARECAATMIPDLSVLSADDDARTVSDELIVFWRGEVARIGDTWAPDGVGDDEWTGAVRAALVERIESR